MAFNHDVIDSLKWYYRHFIGITLNGFRSP